MPSTREGGAQVTSPFEIRPTPGTKSGSIPGHWDIVLKGQDDSLITVWDSEQMAELVCDYLTDWAEARQSEYQAQGVSR